MSTTKLVTLICWIVVAVVLVGLVIWFLTGSLFGISTGFKINAPVFHIGGGFDNLTGPYNEAGSYTVETEGLRSVDLNWVAGEVTVTPYDGSDIKITEYARRALKDDEKLVYTVSGDTLEIQYCRPGMTFNMVTKKIELLVPQSIAKEMNLLKVSATSADLHISDFSVNTLEINETSGDSDIANVNADVSDIHSVSGEILVTGLRSSQLTLGTVSGDIALSGVDADTLQANTTSGEQELSGAFRTVDAGSVSGEIEVRSTVNPGSMKCGTTSGSITVIIPGGSDLTVSYSTTSGKFNSDIPVMTGGSAAYRFTSVSGDIWLKAA
jgi:DUF4097 and DUF4098 domain-containing protein YvlB